MRATAADAALEVCAAAFTAFVEHRTLTNREALADMLDCLARILDLPTRWPVEPNNFEKVEVIARQAGRHVCPDGALGRGLSRLELSSGPLLGSRFSASIAALVGRGGLTFSGERRGHLFLKQRGDRKHPCRR